MIYLFIGTVIGIAICSAFCGAVIFLGMFNDVPEITEKQYAEKMRRRAFYQALYAAAKEQRHP